MFGHEASGIIQSCGPGVTEVKPDDSVIVSLLRSCGECFFCDNNQTNLCEGVFQTDEPGRLRNNFGLIVHRGLRTGCFAEYAVVHQSQIVKIPQQLNAASASLIACGVITGFGSVTNVASVEKGDHTVVIGVGGVGINCVQAARINGAATVIAVDVNSKRLEVAKQFGATHVINPAECDAAELIRSLSSNRGADYVFVATGHPSATESVFRLVRRGGSVVLVGMPPDGEHMSFETVEFIDANQKLLGSKMGNSNLQSDVPKLISLCQSGSLELDELVTGTFSLDQINDAIEATRQGQGLRNVVVF